MTNPCLAYTVTKKFLQIPVFAGEADRERLVDLQIERENGEVLYFFRVPRADRGEASYFASLPVEACRGETLLITSPEERLLSGIRESDEDSLLSYSREEIKRPGAYHAPRGWLNDPNGMIYDNGVYHLYYQYNPMNREWENMSWGHAVSRDLRTFCYEGNVLFPDETGTMFSGCGLKNDRGCFGLPADALLYFYTAAGGTTPHSRDRVFVHRMAYSLDGGKTLIKHPHWELASLEKENRDPKIFWHDESHAYVMSLYLTGNDFGILRSEDLEHWQLTQRFSHPPLWECPDLFLLKDGEGNEKWAFMSADGFYFLGNFDGFSFLPETERQSLYGNALPYAAQSFSGTGERVITIAWLRTENKGKDYRGLL